jgi:alcohol dehydrogenase (cytochrome c)
MTRAGPARAALLATVLLSAGLAAQVPGARLRNAAAEPGNWLTYSGGYASQRHSLLTAITPANVKDLEQRWIFQAQSLEKFAATPLVVDGVMYVTQAPNTVVALDAATGRTFWLYQHTPAPDARLCCGAVNRGVAILGDTLFMGTIDAQLVAIDARSGRPLWKRVVADYKAGYSITLAPLVLADKADKVDKVIVGVAGGEYGVRGFVAAYDAAAGSEVWRFNTIPSPGEPGHDSWETDAWKTGGGSSWLTGSYDPVLNLVYWGIGNPGPDWNPAQRPGDNLYTNSVVALDADTGRLRWHFQFTPHDGADWDAVQIPVLADAEWEGRPRKLLYWANRNGFFSVLDRATGQFLRGAPFVKQNWATRLDERGRPVLAPLAGDASVYPGVQGGTNWYSPSFSPRTGLFYIPAWDDYSSVFIRQKRDHVPGQRFMGGRARSGTPPLRRGPVNTWTEEAGHGVVVALDPRTGEAKWRYHMHDVTDAGILTTASDLLFTGGREGYFFALDARSGALLWRKTVGGQVAAAPISYQVGRTQYVAIAAGHSLFAYALPD